jgi:hypothetical protein
MSFSGDVGALTALKRYLNTSHVTKKSWSFRRDPANKASSRPRDEHAVRVNLDHPVAFLHDVFPDLEHRPEHHGHDAAVVTARRSGPHALEPLSVFAEIGAE